MVNKKFLEDENYEGSTKRRTPQQLQTLENLYSEDRYPSHETMEDLAVSLKLTYKQVRGWFVERRRREKRETSGGNDAILSSERSKLQLLPSKKHSVRPPSSRQYNVWSNDLKDLPQHLNSSTMRSKKSKLRQNFSSLKNRKLSVDFILKKVFRKDGPPLGVKFDPLPPGAFCHKATGPMHGRACERSKTATKKRKVSSSPVTECEVKTKKTKHGMGKGLMTVWNATNPGAASYHTTVNIVDRDVADMGINSGVKSTKPLRRKTKKSHQKKLATVLSSSVPECEVNPTKSVSVMKHGMGKGLMTVWRATNPGAGSYRAGLNSTGMDINSRVVKSTRPLWRKTEKSHQKLATKQVNRKRNMGNKLLEKKKHPIRKTRVSRNKATSKEMQQQEECVLALEGLKCQEYADSNSKLVDDEELELRELQAGPNPMTCSAHLAFKGMHSCPLCKDLLSRFPPHSVKMKQPLCMQPWVSSLELVKKLFKVFSFLYSHSEIFDICPFTLDEFAQAFDDKDSKLLGKIHVALLKVLFLDLETELRGESHPHVSKNYRFMGFVHSVKQQQFILSMWNRYLNPITWTEILRQVLIAAGFNTKHNKFRRELLSKDDKYLAECGLSPGTLKGEVFNILAEQGSSGLQVSELAKSLRVVDLHLTNTTEELEYLICSTLSSDITLFEKISSSAYRLRSNPLTSKGERDHQSDSEDSRSVDVSCGDSIFSNESELDSARTSFSIINHRQGSRKKHSKVVDDTEIDESNPGELWVLALMEGEYSELSLEEKLTTLVALADLTSAGSSIRVDTPATVTTRNAATIPQHGGAKIKRASGKENTLFWENNAPEDLPLKHRMECNGFTRKSTFLGRDGLKLKGTEAEDVESDEHSMHSIYVGSDRRFNSYWLFLGPCNAKDPGHRRVYFESSEDGHWEVIDTKEGLSSLLSVLDGRGSREARLLSALTRLEVYLSEAMSYNMTNENDMRQSTQSDQSCIDAVSGDGSSPISDVDNRRTCIETVNECFPSSEALVLEVKMVEEQKEKWERLQALDAWIWNSFYSNLNAVKHSRRSFLDSFVRCTSCHDLYWRDEKHCKICHTTFELDFDLEQRYAMHVATCREKENENMFPKHRVLATQLQALKAALHAVEGGMPKEALVSAWTTSDHKLWVTRLRRTSSLSELLQVLTDFVGAINEDWLCKCCTGVDYEAAPDEIIHSFTTMPQTTSAVALWLVRLDAFIAPHLLKFHPGLAEGTHTRQKRKLAQV